MTYVIDEEVMRHEAIHKRQEGTAPMNCRMICHAGIKGATRKGGPSQNVGLLKKRRFTARVWKSTRLGVVS